MIEPACPDCSISMEEGYVLDLGHSNRKRVAQWISGPPETSFWTGLKTAGRTRIQVSAWRCRRCGLLKMYAPPVSAG